MKAVSEKELAQRLNLFLRLKLVLKQEKGFSLIFIKERDLLHKMQERHNQGQIPENVVSSFTTDHNAISLNSYLKLYISDTDNIDMIAGLVNSVENHYKSIQDLIAGHTIKHPNVFEAFKDSFAI